MPQHTPPAGPIRTGIIGFGTSGRVFHAPLVSSNPEFSLDLIVTGNPERRTQAIHSYPGARILATSDDLFDRVEDLDLVVIGSPSATHIDLAHAARDAGLAVVVDKPFAVTPEQGRGVIEKAERLGLHLTVFQNRRWDGDFLTLRALVAAGALGTVRRFESRFEWWEPEQAQSWRAAARPSEGGGVLYDLGAHLIDQAIQLFGPVDDVHAEVLARREGAAADDDTFVALHHGSGVHSHLWMNGMAAQVGPRFRVLGSTAGYTKWGTDGQETALRQGMLPTDEGYGLEAEATWGVLGRDGALTRVPTQRGSYDAFYAALAEAILRGGPVPVKPRDALRVIDVIERVHRMAG